MFLDAALRRPEAGAWIFTAYERNGSVQHQHRSELIGAVGWLSWERGSPEKALALGRVAVSIAPVPFAGSDRLAQWSLVAGLAFTGNPTEARAVIESVLPTLVDEPFLQVIWNYLASLGASLEGRPLEGHGASMAAERIGQSLGSGTALAFAFWARANATASDDPRRVAELLSIAAEYCRSVRSTFLQQPIEQAALGLRRRFGDPPAELLLSVIQHARVFARNGLMVFGWPALVTMSFCLHEMGHDETAAICLLVRRQAPVHMMSLPPVETLLAELTEKLGHSEMARLEEVARGLDFAATLNLAESG